MRPFEWIRFAKISRVLKENEDLMIPIALPITQSQTIQENQTLLIEDFCIIQIHGDFRCKTSFVKPTAE
jgi:hypothetical protein